MQNFRKGKQLIGDIEFITCPYCDELNGKNKKILDGKHLKKHGKCLDDVKMDFPNHVTMTNSQHQARVTRGKALKTKTKLVKCYYYNDNDCPGEYIKVPITSPGYIFCNHCKNVGKPDPDGRSNGSGNKSRKITLKERYGNNITNAAYIPGVAEQKTKTCEERYGGAGFASKELSKKTRDTTKLKYGNSNIMKTKEGKKHFIGDLNPMKNKEISKKVSVSLKGKLSQLKGKNYIKIHGIEKANLINQQKSNNFLEQFIKNDLPILLDYFNFDLMDFKYKGAHIFHNYKCRRCGTILNKQWNSIQQGYRCEKCFPRNNGKSRAEEEIQDFLYSILPNEEILNNKRTIICPKELDIYFPNMKIAIEYNGLYYHSEQHKNFNSVKYHLNKTIECEKQGIQLIHIFEDEWIFKQDIVKSRLKQILGVRNSKRIHARKCEVKEIEPKIKNEFLEKYHIQGKDNSTIKLGGFYKDELVSAMTFSKGNKAKGSKPKKGIWELNRFCSNSNYHIPGIAGKLLAHFKRNYEWKEIFSYADRRWSTGNLYYQLGFDLNGNTDINYWYIKDGKRLHRFGLRKRPDEPKNISERVLRISEGYQVIWDCGSLKFNLKNI